MELTRKGIFFSMAAVVFLTVITIVVSASLRTPNIDTGDYAVRAASAVQDRLENSYLPMVLRVSSTRMLIEMVDDAQTRGIYLTLPNDFAQALENGTYKPGNFPLQNSTLTEELFLLSAAANASGTNLTIVAYNVSIFQSGTFTATVGANFNYTLLSIDERASFTRSIRVTTQFSILGVKDLYYNTEADTRGWPAQREFRAQLPQAWNNTEWNRTWQNGLYAINTRAPGWYNRLQGITAPTPIYGIETTTPVTFTPPENYTSLDWELFQGIRFNCTYTVIDPNMVVSYITLTEYNLTNGAIVQSPAPPECNAPPTWP